MRLPFRRKDKKRQDSSSDSPDNARPPIITRQPWFPPSQLSSRLLSLLPPPVLERIFDFVCPHARDESYETCEESARESGCMLCDLRDLSHCAQVSRAWRATAVTVLYHSVRIDQVHYCKLEAWLAEKRKQKSRFNRNGIPEDPAQARLRLLRRTVRDDPTRIGKRVQFLKIPYMLREYCHSELAQIIAVLPSLKYIDLPEGMFSDEPNYATLRLEVQARCPNLRKMTYVKGSERSLSTLATGRLWQHLEVLELKGINVDPMTLRAVLGSLTQLRALKISKTESFSDEVLTSVDGPAMPPLEELVLKDTPRLTAAGLADYLSWFETQQSLKVLTLKDTGVQPPMLQEVLALAPALRTLAIQVKISEAFPYAANITNVASNTLETLRYEISGITDKEPYASMKAGYYTYLASSILSGGLPKLRRLYVHDDTFPDQLSMLPPPNAAFAGGHMRTPSNSSNRQVPALRLAATNVNTTSSSNPPHRLATNVAAPRAHRFSSNNPFARNAPAQAPTHTLEIFTKSDEFGKWNFSRVDPLPGATPRLRRPASSYGLAADVAGQGWDRGEARRSIMVGNGAGGFLPLPGQQDTAGVSGAGSTSWRPHSSSGEASRRKDAWP